MALCDALYDLGVSFTFVWCPRHTGIEGDEEADAAAINTALSYDMTTHNQLQKPLLLMCGTIIYGRANFLPCSRVSVSGK